MSTARKNKAKKTNPEDLVDQSGDTSGAEVAAQDGLSDDVTVDGVDDISIDGVDGETDDEGLDGPDGGVVASDDELADGEYVLRKELTCTQDGSVSRLAKGDTLVVTGESQADYYRRNGYI